MKSVIVTGATGVTGNGLVRYLLGKKIEVFAILRPNSQRECNLPQDSLLHRIECNLGEYDQILQHHLIPPKKARVFFHLAWEGSKGREKVDNRNNMQLQSRNITYLMDAVELCHKLECPVFLGVGSQAEYGYSNGWMNEDTVLQPGNGYGMAKVCACSMSRVLCKSYQIKHIWARLFSIYGPYDETHSLVDLSIQKLRKGESLAYTTGEQLWNYLYSQDAGKALYLLSEYGQDGEEYCVASAKARPLKDYIKEIHRIVNPNVEPEFGTTAKEEPGMQVDISKLVQATKFQEEFTFQEGIAKIRDFYVEKESAK
ncbi:MAG: NAD(P)-dependent oxidoreductase [Lachnospiraceae bacterium]